MEKDNKRKVTPDINEELMMNLMVDGIKKDGIQLPPEPVKEQKKEAAKNEVKQEELQQSKPVQKEHNRNKKNLDGSYGEHFLKTHSMTKRGDKSIYIRQEYHERLSRIVQVIGKDEIPLYAYLDNILEHHFEMFEKAIIDDFNEKFKPIF
ncbi:MAG: conjugal transfer protein TraB [Pseudopedobacter saltans]|uniref:Conjugal transfer protein TraB n=1 Tax=Pseudopedobacter saltans TaxID=151895 RepID=A0A2W5G6C1_9SPHI|nr:MAG: conjugal transfer protein TraB [Pseudopedobacter saltans]